MQQDLALQVPAALPLLIQSTVVTLQGLNAVQLGLQVMTTPWE